MTQVLTSTKDLSREAWLEARKRGIGGSDIPAILGLSKYRSPLDVWMEKTGQTTPDEISSEAAYWGTRLEDIVAQEFAERNGMKIRRRNAILQHAEYPWMLANLDREIYDQPDGRGVLEIKTTAAWRADDWENDAVPLTAQCQVQWYLAVTGYQYGYVAALIGGQRYAQSRIDRDDSVIAMLIEAGRAFWHCVDTGEMPAIDGSDRCAEVLADLYPQAESGSAIDLPPTLADLPTEYDAVCATLKRLTEQKTLIENTLKAEMGEAERAYLNGRQITWKNVTQSRLDAKALRADHPDIYAAYAKESSYRRFEMKKEKN